jgi:DNA mismatch endonuclease (patch repair protein)
MRRIRKKDTQPELIVRRTVHALGGRFRLHRSDLPGTPDLTLPRRKLIIQVHGCFWHQHGGCPLARTPKSRLDYWVPKLKRNAERDEIAKSKLEALGWRYEVIWECETKDVNSLTQRLSDLLQS